ncbi:hypothetical protein COK34_06990 [Bacillus thuringiensis]|uniref:hypothetical protein n=1 Tax=Bacillus thuringiensis TaxID=1428 RepID=UPI000BF9DB35|nr:hypothetical protein [Bacillus thuringiensis]PFD66899.1 hypothetical protein CN309_08510 [Bacillus thuringiensis]PFO46532.1 hypothetical protein COJ84_01325 [Bacillus thuringiensis]PFR56354.1 hypothetical protein COK34_06990 [Bacillus thuringiensis]
MENKLKHLEFIQQAITRMASNSFLLKGWTVTIIAGLFAFANKKDMSSAYIVIAFIPTFFFWFLDGFFIYQEKLFRRLYDNVRMRDESNIDFAMNPSLYKNQGDSWIKACFSKTLISFYIPVICIICIARWVMPLL